MGSYECTVELEGRTSEARASIEGESVVFAEEGLGSSAVSFADIMDLRLLNYRLHIHLRDGEVVVSKLGHQTEEFFEKLWQAYAAMSERSLFVESALVMSCEGDYSYDEPEAQAASIAKLTLYRDCLCIVPHDAGARRVPLCFSDEPAREGFALSLQLDTGERYRIARLGGNTDPFFNKLIAQRGETVAAWQAAQRELEQNLFARLGKAAQQYEAFRALPAEVACGLFSAEDEAFWFAAVGQGRAAVELVTEEQTATYLYRYDVSPVEFTARLRHAMEAVKTNRRLIFIAQDEIEAEPLYRMSVDRNAHVRFLRACNAGRIIHTSSWTDKLKDYFS